MYCNEKVRSSILIIQDTSQIIFGLLNSREKFNNLINGEDSYLTELSAKYKQLHTDEQVNWEQKWVELYRIVNKIYFDIFPEEKINN